MLLCAETELATALGGDKYSAVNMWVALEIFSTQSYPCCVDSSLRFHALASCTPTDLIALLSSYSKENCAKVIYCNH